MKNLQNLEFVHITKTAGTSIEDWGVKNGLYWSYRKRDYFRRQKHTFSNTSVSAWHIPPKYFVVNPYQKKTTFTCVRNPYTRLISEYYCPWSGSKQMQKKCKNEFNQWIQNLIKKKDVVSGIPQSMYMTVDFIIKFESLQKDFTTLIHTFDSEIDTTLPHSNKSSMIHTTRFTTKDLYKDTINLINEKYSKDFELFNYKMINIQI